MLVLTRELARARLQMASGSGRVLVWFIQGNCSQVLGGSFGVLVLQRYHAQLWMLKLVIQGAGETFCAGDDITAPGRSPTPTRPAAS